MDQLADPFLTPQFKTAHQKGDQESVDGAKRLERKGAAGFPTGRRPLHLNGQLFQVRELPLPKCRNRPVARTGQEREALFVLNGKGVDWARKKGAWRAAIT